MLSTLRDYEDRSILDAIRGTNVYGREDSKLGSAEDGIVDANSGELRYFVVNAGRIDKQFRFAVPADQVWAIVIRRIFTSTFPGQKRRLCPRLKMLALLPRTHSGPYEREYTRMPGILEATQLNCGPVSAYFGYAVRASDH
jgi:hypothetical protein